MRFLIKPTEFTQDELNRAFKIACSEGDFKIIKYLLTSHELKNHANIHTDNEEGLFKLCENGDLEIIKYLLTSSELKEHADIYANNDNLFKTACTEEYFDIINYFIFDFKIEKTEHIEKYLKENPKEKVENMFKLRELNNQLNNDLKYNKINNKKLKVKL